MMIILKWPEKTLKIVQSPLLMEKIMRWTHVLNKIYKDILITVNLDYIMIRKNLDRSEILNFLGYLYRVALIKNGFSHFYKLIEKRSLVHIRTMWYVRKKSWYKYVALNLLIVLARPCFMGIYIDIVDRFHKYVMKL